QSYSSLRGLRSQEPESRSQEDRGSVGALGYEITVGAGTEWDPPTPSYCDRLYGTHVTYVSHRTFDPSAS
ncbi:MAG TPA: hypothetical protein VGH55_06780, partial [Chthoniobacterales bacterium]